MFDYEALREREVDTRVYEMLYHKDGEYSLTKKEHFEEFLQNMPQNEMDNLRDWIDQIINGGKYMEALGRAFYLAYFDYLEELAKEKAEQITPSIAEMIENRREYMERLDEP